METQEEPAIKVWNNGPIVYCESPQGTRWPDGNFHTAERASEQVNKMVAGEVASYDIDGRRPVFVKRNQ